MADPTYFLKQEGGWKYAQFGRDLEQEPLLALLTFLDAPVDFFHDLEVTFKELAATEYKLGTPLTKDQATFLTEISETAGKLSKKLDGSRKYDFDEGKEETTREVLQEFFSRAPNLEVNLSLVRSWLDDIYGARRLIQKDSFGEIRKRVGKIHSILAKHGLNEQKNRLSIFLQFCLAVERQFPGLIVLHKDAKKVFAADRKSYWRKELFN